MGGLAAEMIGYHRAQGDHIILAGTRAITTVRSRYTEARIARHGQYAVLGAGLDTYGYRADPGVRVFEIDHPATQEWKRGLLAAAGIPVPENVVLVPVDFETDDPVERLAAGGFDLGRSALAGRLGVGYHLAR